MLQTDPYMLRFLAQQISTGVDLFRRNADKLNDSVEGLLNGANGWKGEGANGFEKRGEILISELRKASDQLEMVVPVLHTLARVVEDVQYKQRELENLRSQLSSLHGGWNLKNDAEIAYLQGRIYALEGEIAAESASADMAASAAFEAIRFSESLYEQLSHAASTVAHKAEEVWDNDVKRAGEWLLNGVEEFLDIPEIVDAWHDLTNPNLSMGERLWAAGKIVAYGALDVSMLFGVGEEIKGVQLLAKFGAKYGAKLIVAEGRKEMAATITKGLSDFADGVKNGAEQFFNRGLPVVAGVGVLRNGAGALSGFARYDKAADKILKFSGKVSGKTAEELIKSRKSPNSRLPRSGGHWEGEPGNGKWYSDNSEVQEVTGEDPIEFVNGRPDFAPWTKVVLEFEPGELNGTRSDFDLVYEEIKLQKGFSTLQMAIDWLKRNGLTPHHLDNTTIQLVPTKLHKNIPHIGSASDLRRSIVK